MPLLLIICSFAGIFGIIIIGGFIFSLIKMRSSKNAAYKIIAIITGAILFIVVAFFAWRIGDVMLSPRAYLASDDSLVFEGHKYVMDDFEEFPYGNIEKVGLIRYQSDEEFLSDIFFPSTLYREKSARDNSVLWERGLMLEMKYTRVD